MATYAEQVVADGAVAYWRLNETSGTVADDAVGPANGTISATGVTRNQPGAIIDADKAMHFDAATGGVVTVPRGAFMEWGTKSVTWECWMKVPIGTSLAAWPVPIDTANNGSAEPGLQFLLADGAPPMLYLQTKATDGNSRTAGAPFTPDGQWHHVVAVIDRAAPEPPGLGVQVFYLDGVAVIRSVPFNTAHDCTPSGAITTLTLGRANGGGQPYTGFLDEVAIYHTALTPAQIAAHTTAATVASAGRAMNWTAGWRHLAGSRR